MAKTTDINYKVNVDTDGAESSLDNLEGQFDSVGGAAGGMVGSIKSVGLALKALAMNPIVLTLTAIIAAFGAMVKAMKSSEDGTAALNKIMAVFEQLFTSLMSAISDFALPLFQKLGDIMTDYIIPAFKSLAVYSEAFGKSIDVWVGGVKLALTPLKALWATAQATALALKGDFEGAKQVFIDLKDEVVETAVAFKDDLVDAVNLTVEATQELNAAYEEAKENQDDLFSLAAQIEERQLALNKAKREQLLLDSELSLKSKEARADVKNDTLAVEERLARLQDFKEIEEERAANALSILEKEIQLQQDKMSLGLNTQADEDNLNQLLIQRNVIQGQNADANKRYFTEQKTLMAEAETEEKKIAADKQKREDKSRKDKAKADKKYAKEQFDADKKMHNLKVGLANQAFDIIGGMADEDSAVAKGAAVAQIGVNTYEGAMKAYAQGGIFGAIGAALVTAAGLYSASQAAGINIPKRGKSGSSGSVSTPSISVPSFTADIPSFTDNLTDDISTDESAAAINAQSRAPMKAYVVLDELGEAQGVANSIEENATL